MPLHDHPRWRVALRVVGTIVAVACAIVALWLVVNGATTKILRVGVLLGIWAAVLGSVTLGTTRRPAVADPGRAEADRRALVEAVAAGTAASREAAQETAREVAQSVARETAEAVAAGRELEQRRSAEVGREQDEAARREFALSLEVMLRREMERVLREQLAALHHEVVGLRNDLVEKVGGQIRLERIETTRLIGSDLEALQHQVRRLAEERTPLDRVPALAIATQQPPEPALVPEPAPEPARAAAPEPARPAAPEPARPAAQSSSPRVDARATSDSQRPGERPAPPPLAALTPGVPPPTLPTGDDPFGALPRLSRFVDTGPVEDPAADAWPVSPRSYVGRRRTSEPVPRASGGRRRRPGEDAAPGQHGAAEHSGHRRRPDGDPSTAGGSDDVLARLLGR